MSFHVSSPLSMCLHYFPCHYCSFARGGTEDYAASQELLNSRDNGIHETESMNGGVSFQAMIEQ